MARSLRTTLERELKLGAGPGFILPALPGVTLEPRTFVSTYYDTPSRRLAAGGITLRLRTEDRKRLWQLKFPRAAARLELELAGGGSAVPEEFLDLLYGHLRGEELAPAATLRTRRHGIRVLDLEREIADVVLDRVTILDGRRTLSKLTELEVELLEGRPRDLRRIADVLRSAGASNGDDRPKLFQALDLPAPVPAPPVAAAAPPAEHVRSLLEEQYRAILQHDPGTRLGHDSEELHQLRVATRRLRALLRAARPLLASEWTAAVRGELDWLGGALAPVRDLDVLIEHLEQEVADFERPDRRAATRLIESLAEERAEARQTLLAALRSARYLSLLDALERGCSATRLSTPDISPREIARREFRRLRRSVQSLGPEPADAELHATRIMGKRARYAAELAETTVGKPASEFVRRAKDFQDVVGEHQDAVVAEQRLRELLRHTRGTHTGFAAGRLVERERARRRAARAAFPKTWARLERSGLRAWQ
ncbi:MAG TPA: CYTH and CHAD domain-containing protein [Gaiellaceae bacterium]|nr:CYTH and CHAD domain-containing protein [Gaiellaceae bacterium]